MQYLNNLHNKFEHRIETETKITWLSLKKFSNEQNKKKVKA